MVIAANAKTAKHRAWDATSAPPGIGAVLDVITGGPMDDVSSDSIDMIEGHFSQMRQLSSAVKSCNQRLDKCPGAAKIDNPITTDFTFAELTFDDISDRRLRVCLQELPTSFSLPEKTVDLLRVAAAYLLMNSTDFVEGMKRLDSSWSPREVIINPKLIDQVCGPIVAPGVGDR